MRGTQYAGQRQTNMRFAQPHGRKREFGAADAFEMGTPNGEDVRDQALSLSLSPSGFLSSDAMCLYTHFVLRMLVGVHSNIFLKRFLSAKII